MKRYLPLVIIGGVLVAVIAVTVIVVRSRRTDTTANFNAPVGATPATTPSVVSTPSPVNINSEVPAGVAVTVEEYGDYQCPPCGALHPEMKKIQQEYGTRINFVFRNLPLPQVHKNALLAAEAAEAARLQKRFWEMHDRLYETQSSWKDEENPRFTFTNYARELGLDTERFMMDMDGNEVQQRLKEDKQQATSHGIDGTPTVLIEGRQLKFEVTNGEGIRKGIDLMLSNKAAGK